MSTATRDRHAVMPIKHERPSSALDPPLLFDARWLDQHLADVHVIDRRPSDFAVERVPGSLNLSLANLLLEDTGPDAIEKLSKSAYEVFSAHGIRLDEPIVLVDDGDGSAAFGVFLAELAGAATVGALHGGIRTWLATTDHPVARGTIEAPVLRSPISTPYSPSQRTVAGITDLVAAEQQHLLLVDARSQLEHEGIVGTPCCDARGHIPGSVHFEWTNTVAATGELTTPQRLEDLLSSAGIHPESDVIVYCHTNPRGALLALGMRHAGHPQTRLALGGMHEWSGRGFPVAPQHDE